MEYVKRPIGHFHPFWLKTTKLLCKICLLCHLSVIYLFRNTQGVINFFLIINKLHFHFLLLIFVRYRYTMFYFWRCKVFMYSSYWFIQDVFKKKIKILQVAVQRHNRLYINNHPWHLLQINVNRGEKRHNLFLFILNPTIVVVRSLSQK